MTGSLFQFLMFAMAAGAGVLALRQESNTIAGMSLAVAFVLLTSWLRYGGVMAAGRHFRAGRPDAAWNELCRVPLHGRVLAVGVRAYYHLLRAAILLDRDEWDAVIRECEAVLAMKKAKSANHATAHGAMAKALAMLGRIDDATEHLRTARSMPHKPALDSLLAKVDATLRQVSGDAQDEAAETS